MKKVGWILAIAVLLVTSYLGVTEGFDDLGRQGPALERSVAFAVSAYGVLGLVGAVGLIRRRPWTVAVVSGWAVATVYAATVASFAFHDPALQKEGTLQGTAGVFLSLSMVCALMVWAARANTRPQGALPPRDAGAAS